MGVKYILQVKSHDDTAWECLISTSSYSGTPLVLRGVSEQSFKLDYSGDSADEPYNTFIKSTLSLDVYNEGQIDINELQQAGDKDFLAKLFRNGLLYWTGYLKPEDIQWNFLTPPQTFTLTFMCGLATLADTPYVHQDLMGTVGIKNRCPMNYIRQILFNILDIKLPIRWTNELECTAFLDDFFTGRVQWSPHNEDFYTYQQGINGEQLGPAQTCGYILEGILAAAQCRIYQSKGKWVIRRVNDFVAGVVRYKEIAATTGIMTVVNGTENVFQRIGRTGYRFINENAVMTVVRGLKSFKTTYNAATRTNIIPNGNFDILNTDLTILTVESGDFLYWGSYDTNLLVSYNPSLDGRSGHSAELVNVTGDGFFTMVSPGGTLGRNGLPIDANTLIKIINFSFTFSPGTGFAPVDGLGLIIWDSKPLEFKMILNQGMSTYYLNEFGTWSTTDAWIPIVVTGLAIGEIAQVSFDKFQGIKVPQPLAQPVSGSVCDLQIIFRVKTGQTYTLDNMQITVDTANDVYEVFKDSSKNTSTDSKELSISSSFGGYMLSNFMTSPFNSDTECAFNDGTLYTGSLTAVNSQAVMRFRSKASQVLNTDMYVANGNWSFDEIYSVDSLLGKKFLPLNATYYIEKCITNMVAIEARNDAVTLRESFYSSNDNQNSN